MRGERSDDAPVHSRSALWMHQRLDHGTFTHVETLDLRFLIPGIMIIVLFAAVSISFGAMLWPILAMGLVLLAIGSRKRREIVLSADRCSVRWSLGPLGRQIDAHAADVRVSAGRMMVMLHLGSRTIPFAEGCSRSDAVVWTTFLEGVLAGDPDVRWPED